MSGDNKEDYIWALQRVYKLLNADTMHGGALSYLPAGGVECENLVAMAVSEIKTVLGPDDLPQ